MFRHGRVPRFRTVLTALLVGVAAAAATPPAPAAPQAAADLLDVPKLLDGLSHTDTAVRKDATEKLSAIGEAARPDLIRAARSDDPERRARAAEILRKLPWDTPRDGKAIRTLLERYGEADDRMRMSILWQVSETEGGIDALLRILAEEPSDAVRWFIAALLSNEREPAPQKKILGLIDTAADDPPVLVLAGNMLMERDRRQALELFGRAIEADRKRPGADIGVLAFAFDALTDDALTRGDVAAAAELLRRQVPRDGSPQMSYRRSFGQGGSHSFARLLALHTYFGPLPGFAKDLDAWGKDDLLIFEAGHEIAWFIARFAPAPPLPWQAVELAAEEHQAAGSFLLRNKLSAAAEAELLKALASPETAQRPALEADTCFALAQTAGQRGDDEAAANFLERAMHIKQAHSMAFTRGVRRSDDDVYAEIHFRRARAVDARGQRDAADAHVKNLLRLMPTNNDQTIEMIDWLKSSGHEQDARGWRAQRPSVRRE